MNAATETTADKRQVMAERNSADMLAYIHQMGWRRTEAARRMGVDKSTMSRWLSGVVPAPVWAVRFLRTLVLLREACPAAVRHLLTHTDMVEAVNHMPAQRLALTYQQDRTTGVVRDGADD